MLFRSVLIRRLAQENQGWGAPKIHGKLQKLRVVVSERSVARYLRRVRRRGDRLKWKGPSNRIVVAMQPDFLAKAHEETAHRQDIELTAHWSLHDRHVASLMLALNADVEDGSPAGPVYGESLANALAVYLVRRYAAVAPKPPALREVGCQETA